MTQKRKHSLNFHSQASVESLQSSQPGQNLKDIVCVSFFSVTLESPPLFSGTFSTPH